MSSIYIAVAKDPDLNVRICGLSGVMTVLESAVPIGMKFLILSIVIYTVIPETACLC